MALSVKQSRGDGYIKIATSTSTKPCHVCGAEHDVWFIEFAADEPNKVLWLRLCTLCLNALQEAREMIDNFPRGNPQ